MSYPIRIEISGSDKTYEGIISENDKVFTYTALVEGRMLCSLEVRRLDGERISDHSFRRVVNAALDEVFESGNERLERIYEADSI